MKSKRAIVAFGFWLAVGFGQNVSDPSEPFRKDLEANPRSSLAHFRIGEIYLQNGSLNPAANEFRSALNGDLQPRWTEVWSHTNLGRIYDRSGQTERAKNEYRLALAAGDYTQPNAIDEANQYLIALQGTGAPTPLSDAPARIAPSQVLAMTDPEYSDEARVAELEGTVVVTGTSGKDGHAMDLRVARSLGLGLDEKAVEAVRQWRFKPDLGFTSASVDFAPSNKDSRWHLISVGFLPPEGASRPTVLSAYYPSGAGVFSASAVDEGRLLGAMGRQAFVAVSFEVNEKGVPVQLQAKSSSDDVWNDQAISVLREWRFNPGMKDGKPVAVPCTFEFVWGPRVLQAKDVSRILAVFHPAPLPKGDVSFPVVINQLDPAYPEQARIAGLEGTVTTVLVVGDDGIPRDIRVTSGLGSAIDEGVRAALGEWRFSPPIRNGEPASTPLVITVKFELPDRVTSNVSRPPLVKN